jgi:DNA-binding NtrC family response regulator
MSSPEATSPRLLVIDDEEAICLAFRRFFERRGWQVRVASTAADGWAELTDQEPDVVFLDIRLPDGDGLGVLADVKQAQPALPVIVMTAYGGLRTVMDSIIGEAFDYLPKPIDLDEALRMADRAREARAASPGQGSPAPPGLEEDIVGRCPVMQSVFRRLAVLARSDCSVLVLGATGTGKELAARSIHRHSDRSDGPFVAVNCGAIPESLVESDLFGHARGAFTGADRDRVGRFQAADGGVLFLDEIGELPAAAQVKLLRALDAASVEPVGSSRTLELDVRVIAATNRDLAADVEAGRFRADLYYRLAVVQVQLPPLRERGEDILLLASHFLSAISQGRRAEFSPAAREAMLAYPWPGNVRELRNAMLHVHTVAPGGTVRLEDLPSALRGHDDAPPPIDDPAHRYVASLPESTDGLYAAAVEPVEREVIRQAMLRCGQNQSQAAELLGLHRNTLRKKLRELGLLPR